MQSESHELWWAAAAMAAITALYLVVMNRLQTVPAAGSLFGHGLGIVGFLLMLSTEILYSLRKLSRQARWGRTAAWLNLHIFTGLVGSYMVLLHTAWSFNQLAGIVMLLTIIVVASGFVGRYIYTAVPRTADGTMLARERLEAEIAAAGAEWQAWLDQRPAAGRALALQLAALPDAPRGELTMVLGRALIELRHRRRVRRETARLDAVGRGQAAQMEKLLARQRQLRRQVSSLVAARRLLGIWHGAHIPIGMALFTAAFVHIAAALYYATLLR